jgi:ABC-type glycerol-3-phosphate transport system substrate-binding protein
MSKKKSASISILSVTTAVLFIALLIITTQQPAFARQEEIVVWHALPRENTELFNTVIQNFEQRNHGLVKVTTRVFDCCHSLNNELLRTSETPDVALIDTRWQRVLVNRHRVIPVEDMMSRYMGSSVGIMFRVDTFDQMLDACRIDRKMYSLPMMGYNRALLINRDILKTFSIDKHPTNWGEIITIGKQICDADPNDDIWGFLIPTEETPEHLATFFKVFLWQSGRDIVEPFMNGEIATFDSSEGKAVLNMFIDMVRKHNISPGSVVERSKVAMTIGTPQDYLEMMKQGTDVRVIRWPGKSGTVNDLVVYGFMVFDKGNEWKQEKIWHLIYNATEFKTQLELALKTPYLPRHKQVTLSPPYYHLVQQYPGLRVFLDQTKNSRMNILNPEKQQVMTILGENIRLALRGDIPADEAMKTASEKANQILDPGGELRAKKEQFDAINNFVDRVWLKENQ